MLNGNANSADEGLWALHLPAFNAFHAADTQWRTAGGGLAPAHFLGLDYAAAEVSFRQFGITLTPDQWRHFRAIERAATHMLNGEKLDVLLAQAEQLH